MSTVIKNASHVENAARFVNVYGKTSNTDDYLYLANSKPSPWADPANPDVPVDSTDEETGFWSTLIGMKKVDKTKISPVVPRITWTSGQNYVTFDSSDINVYNTSFYVINSESRVYKCTIANPTSPSTLEPLEASESGSGAIAVNPDGYAWQYLYEIPQVNVDNLLNDNWMPVNYGDTIPVDSKDDEDAIYTLGAKYVLIQVEFKDTDSDLGAAGTSFSRTALIGNPLDDLGNQLTSTTANPAGLTLNSGRMLHIENKFAITRSMGQSEIQETIIAF